MTQRLTDVELESLRRSAEQTPHDAARWLAFGVALRQAARHDASAGALVRAVGLRPDWDEPSYQMGLTLRGLGDQQAARLCLERASDLSPQRAEVQLEFARTLVQTGDAARAVGHYHAALALEPSSELWLELAALMQRLGRRDSALSCYQRVIADGSAPAEVYNDAGNLLCALRRFDEGIRLYRRALELAPTLALSQANLGVAHKSAGSMAEAVSAFRKALELDPNDAVTRGNLLFSLAYHPDVGPAELLAEAREFGRRHVEPLHAERKPHGNDRRPERKLRIGYLSSDFRDHVSNLFVLPLLELHDRSAYELHAYSSARDRDGWTERARAKVEGFHDIFELDDAAAAARIRADGIDVLVDLTMHASNPRQLVLARTPAPVQVCWLAYPGTTGNDGIGYRLTDPYLDPPDREPLDYTERSLRLPHTFWCYDPHSSGPPPSALPALAKGSVTFGCLNNFCKVNERTLLLWARVLREVPGSRLLLLVPRGEAEQRARRTLTQAGVAESALELVDRMPRAEYLATFGRIDLALDTLPYNGHTTSMDAAWMGVPTLTLAGATVAGRAGISLAMNLGLPQLITRSPDQFVNRAVELASDLARLSELRRGLRARLKGSPVMDAPAFARDIEAAYRSMWRAWCEAH